MEITLEQAYNDALNEVGRLTMENRYLKARLHEAQQGEDTSDGAAA